MKNRLSTTYVILSTLFILILSTFFILINLVFDLTNTQKLWLSLIVSALALTDIIIMILSYFSVEKKREQIKKTFNYYVENEIASSGMGVLIYNDSQDVIWTSKFIEERLGRLIGRKIYTISPEFKQNYIDGHQTFRFKENGIVFEAKINVDNKSITISDVTNSDMIYNQYISEKLVVGELEIDNFQQFQVTLPEEVLFKLTSKALELMDSLSEQYNLIYRQYVNGKFIFFTNQESLDKMMESNFSMLDQLRNTKVQAGITLSASIGIGAGTTSQRNLSDLARDGLTQAQARGGDQVAVMISKEKPRYFGSKRELSQIVSRVKIKQTTELFESRLKSPEIKNIIIYPHVHADLDAIGSALGIAAICDTFKKNWVIQSSNIDSTTTSAMKNLPEDILEKFVKPSKAAKMTNSNTLVVVVDTAEFNRIENPNALKRVKKDNVFIFDHHRVSKLPEDVAASNVYIDTTASSASEIVTEAMNFISLKVKLRKQAAQMLINGIYLDTQTFNKSTSSRTYTAASFLENAGANSAIASDLLKIPANESPLINQVLSKLDEVKPGFFIASYEGEISGDIVAKIADEILRTQGRKAAFVIAKIPSKKEFKMSARSIDTNIQKIAEAVGGGGHFTASAAVSAEPLPVFVDNIRQAIISYKGD